MRLGEIIKDYRKTNKTNLDTFSKRSGISRAYISLLEKGTDPRTGNKIMPSITVIKKAASAMDIGFDELFGMLDEEISLKDDDHQMDLATITVVKKMRNFSEEQKKLVLEYVKILSRIAEHPTSDQQADDS